MTYNIGAFVDLALLILKLNASHLSTNLVEVGLVFGHLDYRISLRIKTYSSSDLIVLHVVHCLYFDLLQVLLRLVVVVICLFLIIVFKVDLFA